MAPAPPSRLLDALAVRHTGAGRRLDLADVRWLDPLHLVGVAAHAQLAQRQGSRLIVHGLPADQATYAARMHLGRMIERFGGEHDLPDVTERDLHDSLLELQPLRSPADVRRLTELVYRRVAPHDEAAARALHVALAEVGDNVCQHARSIGFVAAQTIGERGLLRFAVADTGVGLRATLASIGAADDAGAVRLALSGERRRRTPGRGYGLPSTVRIITALRGELLLASGDAAAAVRTGGTAGHRLAAPFHGTIFEGSVPAGAPVPDAGQPAGRRSCPVPASARNTLVGGSAPLYQSRREVNNEVHRAVVRPNVAGDDAASDGGRPRGRGLVSVRTVRLPRLVAGRDYADELVQALGLAPGAEVVIDAGELLSGTPSFAAALVERLLVAGQASSVRVVGGPAEFTHYLQTAAGDLGVRSRLTVHDAAGAGTVS
ncbi:MAG TPA: ATP-binding protein [Jatrophihabitans sp.]|nr:ATP-binding protein [Jatrophihabitans sp.]